MNVLESFIAEHSSTSEVMTSEKSQQEQEEVVEDEGGQLLISGECRVSQLFTYFMLLLKNQSINHLLVIFVEESVNYSLTPTSCYYN